jgi:hypothetical protein
MTNPKTPIAFVLCLREQGHDQREGDRGHDRAADPLHRPSGDEHALAGGEPAQDRGAGEERDAAQEHPAVPEKVAQPSAQQQEASEGEQVGVYDPGERGL